MVGGDLCDKEGWGFELLPTNHLRASNRSTMGRSLCAYHHCDGGWERRVTHCVQVARIAIGVDHGSGTSCFNSIKEVVEYDLVASQPTASCNSEITRANFGCPK